MLVHKVSVTVLQSADQSLDLLLDTQDRIRTGSQTVNVFQQKYSSIFSTLKCFCGHIMRGEVDRSW